MARSTTILTRRPASIPLHGAGEAAAAFSRPGREDHRAETVEELDLLLVGQTGVAVARHVLEELLHGSHRRPADEPERRLVQIDDLT